MLIACYCCHDAFHAERHIYIPAAAMLPRCLRYAFYHERLRHEAPPLVLMFDFIMPMRRLCRFKMIAADDLP